MRACVEASTRKAATRCATSGVNIAPKGSRKLSSTFMRFIIVIIAYFRLPGRAELCAYPREGIGPVWSIRQPRDSRQSAAASTKIQQGPRRDEKDQIAGYASHAHAGPRRAWCVGWVVF